MTEVMYYLLIGTFVTIPVFLAIFLVIARTSEGWAAFALDRNVLSRLEVWGFLILVLITVVGSLVS